MNKTPLLFRLFAFIYRKTGWYSPYLEVMEYRFIKSQYGSIAERQAELNGSTGVHYSFKNVINVMLGDWQIINGLVRPFTKGQIEKRINKLKKRVAKRK